MCKKNPIFITFSGKKRSNWEKIKKSWCGHQLQTMTYFSKYHTFDPLLYLGCQMLRTHFFLTFSGKNRSNNKIFGKKIYGHQLGPMTHFLTTPKFDLLSYIYIVNFLNLPVRALIHDLQKKNLQASTRTHDPFLTTPKFDLLLYIGEKCVKKPYFYHFFWKKEVKLGKNKKKLVRASTADHDLFFQISHI